ncbi:hypothetical protein [Croceicoccus sp. BE223]|uniref:hypothetical protein n=1 Tax=Croceicoccus sp. BE223 TaxID=2817716 RepID=UPI002858B5CC|nr:hypothetical protein [Croceicoccus sp. BE223]MDR7101259.1 S1-C subfamily serine protease [Croceicoccus sp. BE223]
MSRTLAGAAIVGAAALVVWFVALPGMGANTGNTDWGQALLSRNGATALPGSVSTIDPTGSAGATMGREFTESVDLATNPSPMGPAFVITEASDAGFLERYKLRKGDILMDMDGRPLDSARIAALPRELATLDAVELTFMRDGQMRKRLITFAQ